MATFAATFRELVMPGLRQRCRVQALFVTLDMETFAGAFAAVMRHASQRGASGLPDDLLAELADWIGTTILGFVDAFEPAADEARRVADKVAADILRWEIAAAGQDAAWQTR